MLLIILALLPLLIFCLLLLFRHSASLLKISFFTLFVTIIISLIFWYSPLSVVTTSLSQGLLIAIDILLIIFGAIFFLEILKKNKVTESLAFYLDNFSSDLRIQVIMLAWFLENFLEGIAGFGTPSTVVAPLLIVLGLSPLKAVIIALLGNSTSVPFGAVGTPIRIGLAAINPDPISIATTTALYNLVGFIVPLFMLWVLLSSQKNRLRLFLEATPLALWSGIAFVVPSYIISFFGIEFPSILGSIIGIILVIFTSRLGIFIPKTTYRLTQIDQKPKNLLSLKKTLLPYALFIALLIFSKFFLSGIITLNPGLIFIVATLIIVLYSKIKWAEVGGISILAIKKSIEPFLVTGAMAAMIQLMNNSASTIHQLPSITETISILFSTQILPILAPFIGALGSFITGSATVSGIMFGSSVHFSSLSLGLDPIKILALTLVGAGAGNMIALSDVLVAKTVSGSKESLRNIILSLLPFCLIYLILIALLGII